MDTDTHTRNLADLLKKLEKDGIADYLKKMTRNERIEKYIFINERVVDENGEEIIPSFRNQFNQIFHKEYNDEAIKARDIMVELMEPRGPFPGGKTRRNRRRRSRRSLKRKHSRRR